MNNRSKLLILIFLLANGNAVCASQISQDLLIVPGKSVGKIELGTPAIDLRESLGSPVKEQPGAWMEYILGGGLTDVFLRKGKVSEVRFSSKKLQTQEGMNLSSYGQKKWHDRFDYSRLQWHFVSSKQQLKTGGLAIYHLNIDSMDPKSPTETIGLVYDGEPLHEPISIEGERNGGWQEWDGSPVSLWDKFKHTGRGAIEDNIDAN